MPRGANGLKCEPVPVRRITGEAAADWPGAGVRSLLGGRALTIRATCGLELPAVG